MPIQYSPQLILETIDCFKQEDRITLSPEQANEYLNSLGNLYLAFSKESERVAQPCASGQTLVDQSSSNFRGNSNTSDTLQNAT